MLQKGEVQPIRNPSVKTGHSILGETWPRAEW